MTKKVLFVDDNEDWRMMVSTALSDAGYQVLTAKDAGEVLEQMEGANVDLAVLDVDLAGESGVSLMKFLNRNHPDVPIILYTGLRHDDDTILKMLQEGAYQYLPKGTMSDLLTAVRRVLTRGDAV